MRRLINALPGWARIALMVIAAVASIWLLGAQDAAIAPAVDESGTGIVAFEFAATPERAEEILDGWGRAGRTGAERSIRIDYAFIVAYTVLLSVGCATVARRLSGRWARLGWWLAGLMLVAGLLDAVENTLLLRVIDGYRSGGIGAVSPALAAAAAGLKFAIVIATWLFIVGALIWLWGWGSAARRGAKDVGP